MQKFIEIDWLQNVDIIQRNALSQYIYNTNDVSNNCERKKERNMFIGKIIFYNITL